MVERLRSLPTPRSAIDQAMADVQSRIQYASGDDVGINDGA